jgi:hypothetical protein
MKTACRSSNRVLIFSNRPERTLVGVREAAVRLAKAGLGEDLDGLRNQAWLLKNSIFSKTAGIWGIENV